MDQSDKSSITAQQLRLIISGSVLLTVIIGVVILSALGRSIPEILVTLGIAAATVLTAVTAGAVSKNGGQK